MPELGGNNFLIIRFPSAPMKEMISHQGERSAVEAKSPLFPNRSQRVSNPGISRSDCYAHFRLPIAAPALRLRSVETRLHLICMGPTHVHILEGRPSVLSTDCRSVRLPNVDDPGGYNDIKRLLATVGRHC